MEIHPSEVKNMSSICPNKPNHSETQLGNLQKFAPFVITLCPKSISAVLFQPQKGLKMKITIFNYYIIIIIQNT